MIIDSNNLKQPSPYEDIATYTDCGHGAESGGIEGFISEGWELRGREEWI